MDVDKVAVLALEAIPRETVDLQDSGQKVVVERVNDGAPSGFLKGFACDRYCWVAAFPSRGAAPALSADPSERSEDLYPRNEATARLNLWKPSQNMKCEPPSSASIISI